MSRGMLTALLLLGLAVLVLIFNRGHVELDLIFGTVSLLKSLAFLFFLAAGVVIGVLLR